MTSGLKKSIALHLLFLVLWFVEVPMFWWNRPDQSQAPIIVDLKNVKISEITNLPPKAKFGKEDKEASKVKRKIENNYAKEEKSVPKEVKEEKAEEKKEEPKIEEEKPKKDFLVAPQPKKPQIKKQAKKEAPKKKKEPVKTPKKEEKKDEPKLANPLKSLLASVDALAKEANISQTATIKEGTDVAHMGIEGGTAGSYFSELSISEMDALSGQLRACWNLDPGAMGIEDMIIEIKAQLNQDGGVYSVEVLNKARYTTDSHFRSVADSAVRAVHICAPYKILSEKYAAKYEEWKVLRLRFNPIDQSVK
jgi:outer membrane biosynthesis protein TonB